MSYTELILKTNQAKEAMVEGIIAFLLTGDLHKGWDAMILCGKKNLSYPAVKVAILLDILKVLSRK